MNSEGKNKINSIEQYNTIIHELQQWFEKEENDSWTNLSTGKNKQKRKTELYSNPPRNGCVRTRCKVECSCPQNTIVNFNNIADEEQLKQYDNSMTHYKVLKEIAKETEIDGKKMEILIVDTGFKLPYLIISPRRFISIHINYRDTDGSHVWIQGSMKAKDLEQLTNKTNKESESSNMVLAEKRSGLRVKPVEGNDNVCSIERIIEMNANGSIPTWVQDKAKTSEIERLTKLAELTESYHQSNKK